MDDGTTLNKYSEALSKVGINIKEANGDMKDMDSILNELGAKWGTLAKDQQLALAQTVAGVRQYNQLIALMDNWDTFQENLNVAYNAEGTLNEQAEIYAESWEAASKRVQAAAEGIFQELLNDDFFIDILNGFEGFLTGINNVIDGVGGLKTILLSVGGIFLKQYAKEIPAVLSTLGDNFDVITGKAEKNR
jgi:TP901 family phage tail tape measure protein